MDTRKVILLVGALLVAGITAFLARTLLVGAPAPQAQATVAGAPVIVGPEVLVATRSLPVGTILDATALKFQPWPKELVENAYYLKEAGADIRNLMGTVVRNPITAGQPVTQGALVKPGDRGFLAAALGPGMRAVTVPVSAQTSVAGFVFPGDRVDLVLSSTVAGGGEGPPLKASETIVRNLRVLATDQRTADEKDDKGNVVVNTFSTVTVEATPRIAEEIAVAQSVGSLSLSLRSIADSQVELEQAIASGTVKLPDGDPRAERAMMLQLATQPTSGTSGGSFVTGADVSRFQRRTVPAKSEGGFAGGAAPMASFGGPAPAAMPSGPAPAVARGPVVRIARGNAITEVPVGGK